jgi:hypothetical protein
MHGASAAHVRNKAMQRLRAMVHPAISVLEYLLDFAESDAVKLAVAKYVLDYAGFKSVEKIQQDGHVVIEVEFVAKPLPTATNGHVLESYR